MAEKLAIKPVRNLGASGAERKSVFRADIQGLRALAVLVVIADHLFAYPSGGFVGVDVFFVISGFLITGLLLKEHDRTGHISFVGFYRRRAKRILPASALVLAATAAGAYFVFNTGRSIGVFIDAAWAFCFTANWRFASVGTDYFQGTGAVSPLQHFWSLAVEEQFYFVWPWLMLLIFVVVGRKAAGDIKLAHRAVAVAMFIIVAASFSWAVYETATSPTWAYFSTLSRTWELGIGALLAVGSTQLRRLPAYVRPVLAWAGLAGIVASLFVVSSDSLFPAPWAALPVLSTAFVIAAGTGGEQRFLAPITNPLARYIGNISYSLYLWHFPVIVLGQVFFRDKDMLYFASTLALMAVLSVASYHVVEDPIRKSSWLDPRNKRALERPKSSDKSSQIRSIAALGVLALAASITTGVALSLDKGRSSDAQISVPHVMPSPSSTATSLTAQAALAAKVEESARATEWPELSPSMDGLGRASLAPEWSNDGCLGLEQKALANPQANAERCVYGDPKAAKTAMVLGDSVAISYVPAIRAALEPRGYKVLVYTMQQCPAAKVSVLKLDKSPHPECDAFRDWTWTKANELHPDLLFLTSTVSPTLASGAQGSAFLDEWAQGYGDTFRALNSAAKRTVVLDPPPGGQSLSDCATRISRPSDCKTTVSKLYADVHTVASDQVQELGNKSFEVLTTRTWFCTDYGYCPSFMGTTPVYADGTHLTAKYSSSLGPVLAEALKLAA
ncbi:acyltransferase family protein [Arthrobacter sp. B1I2]|uniref:acyltransferase family protein n=1 Tax=Arthrobacter sp. B1I2 TaxID=3042263 RepID=UPI0027852792|nr:acyltransferase family protein [Arthrobacter sp. B1I2]MDQ0731136.1 peptidoglycan/LPS O-acetylase OafA/YrhL [Arthrobacter sp. B1I2]